MTYYNRRMSRTLLATTCLAALVATGCEKAGPKASGELGSTETTMLARLPPHVDVVMGGNVLALQKQLANSPLVALGKQMQDATMNAWQDCTSKLPFERMIGTLDASVSKGFDVRLVMSGVGLDALASCADQANIAHSVDPDRKFMTLTLTSQGIDFRMGYLVLDDGTIYTQQRFGMEALTSGFPTPKRAAFEAAIAAAKSDNAASDEKLQKVIARADRRKGVWFAGNLGNTVFGDKVGDVFGSLDFSSGMAIDVSAELKDEQLADKAEKGIEDARDAAGYLDKDLASILEDITFKRDGNRIRLAVKVSNEQLQKISRLAKRFGGGPRFGM